jgi:hypothetical protein
MTTTEQMLEGLGILGTADATSAAEDPTLEPSATAAPVAPDPADAPDGESLTLAEALADGPTDEPVPQDAAAAADDASETPEEAEARKLDDLEAEVAELRREKEAFLAAGAEEQFEADWGDVFADGQGLYQNLVNQVKERGYANGRTRTEVDAVIKHMIYEGNDIERLGAPAGTPGFIEWQQETLMNYALAKAERGQAVAAPNELERLTTQYNLTADDQVTLRQFANYPPEAREVIAKNLGAKNMRTTTKRQAAEEVAATNVAARMSNQTPPGVPGPAEKKKDYTYTHEPPVRRQETQLFARRMGLMR